jgi:hypothetical protein
VLLLFTAHVCQSPHTAFCTRDSKYVTINRSKRPTNSVQSTVNTSTNTRKLILRYASHFLTTAFYDLNF